MEDNSNDEIVKHIRFGSRQFQAPAKRIDASRHVFRLIVSPSPIQYWLPSWTPQLVCSWLHRLLPEWFLPTTVILKERNPERADSYENEIDTYKHLQPLQGTHIPRMLGECVIHDHERTRFQMSKRPIPALLLEYIDGVRLHELPAEELKSPHLLDQLREMYELLTENGVVHGDPQLHNFLWTGQKVVPIDFEFSNPLPSDITNRHELETLKVEIEQREEQAQEVGSVQGSGRALFIDGSRVH